MAGPAALREQFFESAAAQCVACGPAIQQARVGAPVILFLLSRHQRFAFATIPSYSSRDSVPRRSIWFGTAFCARHRIFVLARFSELRSEQLAAFGNRENSHN
jgi:hypothetical protein